MTMNTWDIHPLLGLGSLNFGMTPTIIIENDLAYGRIVANRVLDPFAGNEMYEHFVATLGEEEARAAMAVIAEAGIDTRPQLRVIYETGVSLSFVDDQLEDIMLDRRSKLAQFEGNRFFDSDPLPVLRALQKANGEPPFVKGPDCYFSNIFVTAFECIIRQENGRIRPTNEATDEAQQKTIGWRRSPRNQSEDLSGHVPVDLLGL